MILDRFALQVLDKDEFIYMFGEIYEHSSWVAEGLWEDKECWVDSDDLAVTVHQLMKGIVDNQDEATKLALLRAHPDLAGRAAMAGKLTMSSTKEQASAGLDQCSAEELELFHQLNDEYKSKFDFPFIMAVKGANKDKILNGFKQRIPNTREVEFATALAEVHKIAKFRLDALFTQ